MKKIIMLFLGLMLVTTSALALTPEEIKGKWASNKISDSDPNGGGSIDITLTFNFDGASKASFTQGTSANIDLGQGAKLFMYNEVVAEGEYTVDGDSISFKIDPATVKINLSEDDIRIIGVDDVAAVNGMKEQMVAGTQQNAPMMAEEMAKKAIVLNNVMVLPKKLTAMVDGKMVTFKKK